MESLLATMLTAHRTEYRLLKWVNLNQLWIRAFHW